MDKISRILRLANNFYKQALIALGEDEEDPKPIDITDKSISPDERLNGDNGLFDNIKNDRLFNEIEEFIDAKTDLLRSYQKLSSNNEEEKKEVDLNKLQAASNELQSLWERFANSNYLNLAPDSEDYEEIYPPNQILELIEEVLEDTQKTIARLEEDPNFDRAEAEAIHRQSIIEAGMPTGAVNVENQREGDTELALNKKNEKIKEYIKLWRQKLKDIRKFGPERLAARRKEILDKIENNTNTEEVKELKKRLQHLPDPEMLAKQKARQAKYFENIKKDPEKYQKYIATLQGRQVKFRASEKEKFKLVDIIQNSTDSTEKNMAVRKLIKLQEQDLERKGLNLDDEWVRNDPNIQKFFDINYLINLYGKKLARLKRNDKIEAEKLREQRNKGDLGSKLVRLKENIPSAKKELKKQLPVAYAKRLIDKASSEEHTTYKSYIDAIAAAKQTNDKALIKKAIDALAKELAKIMDTFEEMKEFVKNETDISQYRQMLAAAYKEGTFNKEKLSPEEYALLKTLIGTGNALMHRPGLKPATVSLLSSIVDDLRDYQAKYTHARVAPGEMTGLRVDEEYEDEYEEESPALKKMRLKYE